MDHRVKEAIELVQMNSKARLRADCIARELGISVSRLQHLFKHETGTISPTSYLVPCLFPGRRVLMKDYQHQYE